MLFLFSCDQLKENIDALPYEFSILEGWSHFTEGNYDQAEGMFDEIIDGSGSIAPYYSEAYIGLGWSQLYSAKYLLGAENYQQRQDLRKDAKDIIEKVNTEIASTLKLFLPAEVIDIETVEELSEEE